VNLQLPPVDMKVRASMKTIIACIAWIMLFCSFFPEQLHLQAQAPVGPQAVVFRLDPQAPLGDVHESGSNMQEVGVFSKRCMAGDWHQGPCLVMVPACQHDCCTSCTVCPAKHGGLAGLKMPQLACIKRRDVRHFHKLG
jgi:hypothetical protein